jgi:hypothetical protein
MMDFPIADLMDGRVCSDRLVEVLHHDGLACPRCRGTDASIHRYHRDPVLDFRCKGCGAVYNLFTGTDWHKYHFRPGQVVLILRGFAPGPLHHRARPRVGVQPAPPARWPPRPAGQGTGRRRGGRHPAARRHGRG